MNHIELIGRLTRDPELRYTPNGVAVCSFDLAVNRPTLQGKEKEVDFIRIIAWQKTAELCANYLKKGRQVCIEGRLQIRNYETQDGQKRKVAEVVVNQVHFLDHPREAQESKSDEKPDLDDVNLDDLPF